MLSLPDMPQVQYDLVTMGGGYDQVTSGYQLAPGALRDCVNFACRTNGGYYRIPGYERVDGRASPSDATFVAVAYTAIEGQPKLLAGASIAIGNDFHVMASVSYVDPFGKYIALTQITLAEGATFEGPVFPFSARPDVPQVGTANGIYGGLTIKEMAENKSRAAGRYRSEIDHVPGTGPIRGVFYYKDTTYAIRDSADGLSGVIHKTSPDGWVPIPLGFIMRVSGVNVLPKKGDSVFQESKVAPILGWAISSGDLAAGTGAGHFILGPTTGGTIVAAEGITYGIPGGQSQACMCDTVPVENTIKPGGTYSFSIGNFSASEDTERVYGADGVNDAFEFNGSAYVPINLAMTEKPLYAQVHANHLFLAVSTSLIHSAIGQPLNFEVIKGAGEIGTGGAITGLLIQPGNQGTAALAVFSRDSTWLLYGTSSADWKFVNFNVGVGAWDRSTQNLFDAFAMDDRGVTMMKQSINYGNFDAGTLTHNIRPFVHGLRGKLTCSGINRENGQYRAYFSNGYGLYVTCKPEGLVGHGVVLYPHPVLCNFDGQKSNGDSVSFFGTADGFVMQNDVGTSFDGMNISAFINTNINCAKAPRMRKRFRRCVLELQAQTYVDFQVGYSFEWASPKVLPHLFVDAEGLFCGMPFWDEMTWDTFFWDGRGDDAIPVEMNGTGENVQLMVLSDADYVAEFTVASAIVHFTPRRGNR